MMSRLRGISLTVMDEMDTRVSISSLHVRGPRYLHDPEPARYLAQAVRSTIRVAEDCAVEWLAITAVSTGVYGYPIDEAAEILMQTAFQETNRELSLKERRFALFSPTVPQRLLGMRTILG